MANYKEQKTVKPNIEDVIQMVLKNDKKQTAVEFVEYIKSLRMKPQWASTNSWTLSYKSKRVGYIKIDDRTGNWQLWLYSQYDDYFQEFVSKENSDIQKFIMDNIVHCYKCSACAPGKDMVLLGRELKSICATPNIRIQNPDETYRDFAKRLIALRRSAIEDNRVPKVSYIAIKDRK